MKLFIGICNSQHQVPSEFFWSIIQQDVAGVDGTFYRSTHPWDVVRNNRIIKKFLLSNCDVLAKMDIDQKYPGNYIKRMAELVKDFPVVGPLIYDRYEQNSYMPLAFSTRDRFALKKLNIAKMQGIVEVHYAHTNLFYRREVFESVPPPWYEAHLSEDGLDRANHVDFDVLDKIKAAGYKIMIDLETIVAHETVNYVDREFHERWHR